MCEPDINWDNGLFDDWTIPWHLHAFIALPYLTFVFTGTEQTAPAIGFYLAPESLHLH